MTWMVFAGLDDRMEPQDGEGKWLLEAGKRQGHRCYSGFFRRNVALLSL